MSFSRNQPVVVAVIDAATSRTRALNDAFRLDARFEDPRWYRTLNEAFVSIESDPPDMVLIAPDMTREAEFAMVEALLDLMHIDRLYLDECPDGASASTVVLPLAAQGAVAAIERVASHLNMPSRTGEGRASSSDKGDRDGIVLIGSSTGGIEALSAVLAAYPSNAPPTLIVQHIKSAFVASMVRRLDRGCAAEVRQARDGDILETGVVLVAPGNSHHLVLKPNSRHCALVAADHVSGHRPSVDCLFRSAAPHGSRVVAALLTGMGQDGADGMRQIYDAGGWTIGQNAESCVVYGMPRAAKQLGVVREELALKDIGGAILKAVQRLDVAT